MIYMFLANGFEEIEALATLDILRRAELEVTTVGVGGKFITGAHKITVMADVTENDVAVSDKLEGIILPGGMPGTLNLEKSSKVNEFIDYAVSKNIIIAAICAAPSILGHKGLLKDKTATCYDGFEQELNCLKLSKEYVCISDNIVTAKGAGVALEFGFALAEIFAGEKMSKKVRESMKCIQ